MINRVLKIIFYLDAPVAQSAAKIKISMGILMRQVIFLLSFGLIQCFLWSCGPGDKLDNIGENERQLSLADSLNHFNPKAADSIYRHVLSDSRKGNRGNYVKALQGLSTVYCNRGVFNTADSLLGVAVELSVSMKDTALILQCLLDQGNLNLELGDHTRTENYFKKGIVLAKGNKFAKFYYRFLLGLGYERLDLGDYPAAIKAFTESMKLAEKAGDEENQSLAMENIAMTLKRTGEFREAIKYNSQSMQIRKRLKLVREYASCLQNLGILYRNLGNTDSALIVYRQAYDIFLGLNDSVNMVMVRYNIGNILKNQKKFQEAESEMKSILGFCKQRNISQGQVYSLSALAAIYEETNREIQAIVAIDSAINAAQRYHLVSNMSILYDRRQEILAKLNRYREAYTTVQMSRNLSDSLLSLEKQKEIAALKIQFETGRKEAENVLMKKDIEVQKFRIGLLWTGLILGAIVFIVVISLLYIRHKHLKQQKQFAEEKSIRMEMEKRNREVELDKIRLEKSLKEKELETSQLERQLSEKKIEQLELQEKMKEQELAEHKRVEEVLKESEKKYRELVENSPDAIAIHINGEIVLTNKECLRIMAAANEEELIGKPAIHFVHPDFRAMVIERIRKSVYERAALPLTEEKFVRLDGTEVEVEVKTMPIWFENRPAVQLIIREITERKLAEAEKKLKNENLIKLNATKDKFFSIISHDLKSPFNTIVGFSELLLEQVREKDYDGMEKYAEIILQSSGRAMDLLANLMEWSRSQTGRMDFNPEYFELVSLLDEVTLLFDDIAGQKSLSITKALPPNAPVYADKAMISTVIRNLISNSIKFTMPGGKIIILAEEKQHEVTVSVSDTGVGIPKDMIVKLFRIDENFSTPGTQNEKGTGLGLILCKEFIEKHGGKIWAESEEGKGSTFNFTISAIAATK